MYELSSQKRSIHFTVMPSRQPSPPPHQQYHTLVPSLVGGLATVSVFLLLAFCFRRFRKKRTSPSASDTDSKKPPFRLSYTLLRRGTSGFSPSLRLGQGGFGSVYRAVLAESGQGPKGAGASLPVSRVAVKVMDAGSLQGEREFQNELLFSSKIDCRYVVTVMGFSSNPRKRRMLLVYELMENGSLQDCLFHKKSEELKNWDNRFLIALHVAKGLEYLHHCDPPIIHGDIKPSNILLDEGFNAKIGDLGLARFKVEENNILEMEVKKDGSVGNGVEDNGSMVEETESVITANGFEEDYNNAHDLGAVKRSPESVIMRVETSPEAVVGIDLPPQAEAAPVVSPRTLAAMASPCDGLEKHSLSEGNFHQFSIESGGERGGTKTKKKKKSASGEDWWWKQDNGGDGESDSVKDYVMEWIGNEIKERPRSEWIGGSSNSQVLGKVEKKKKKRRQLDWWVSLEKEQSVKKGKRRPAREWWKEEYCDELERKKKKKKKRQMQGSISDDCYSERWWPRDDELYSERRKKRPGNGVSRSSMDWWLDGLSGELWKAWKNNHDSISGEIPKSCGTGRSSTPSMRGTVCYIAPEYGGGGDLSEKCDVYSYGVLLLVVIAGRRPLQVTGSPIAEFQRANLLSWARHLAHAGKLIDLVDENVQSLNKDQALLCITVALLCLQKSPSRRPSMKEVVGMLSGDLDSPKLPVEFSPSPPSRYPFRSRSRSRSRSSRKHR